MKAASLMESSAWFNMRQPTTSDLVSTWGPSLSRFRAEGWIIPLLRYTSIKQALVWHRRFLNNNTELQMCEVWNLWKRKERLWQAQYRKCQVETLFYDSSRARPLPHSLKCAWIVKCVIISPLQPFYSFMKYYRLTENGLRSFTICQSELS